METSKTIIPVAIIVAGLIIGGVILYIQSSPNNNTPSTSALDNLKPITSEDHILGNPGAVVTLVLFSDLECPFCKTFHFTMKRIMDEYGKNGQLKWVFRHFPLDIHSRSKNESIATECANELGGNEKFWQYLDKIFEITPSDNNLDPAELLNTAESIGLDKNKFQECLTSNKFDQRIEDNINDAIKVGAQGTPYSILIDPNNKKAAIPGALSYEDVKSEIEKMLRQKI